MPTTLSSSADARRRADRQARRRDAVARRVIAVGGVSVIFCVLLMLVLIASTAVPLFRRASVSPLATLAPETTGRELLVAGASDDTALVYTIDDAGVLSFYKAPAATNAATRPLRANAGDARVVAVDSYGDRAHNVFWSDGHATHARVRFRTDHTQPERPSVWSLSVADLPAPEGFPPALAHQFARATDDGFVRVGVASNGTLHVWRYDEEGEFDSRAVVPSPATRLLTAAAFDEHGNNVYAGTADGRLLHWTLEPLGAQPTVITPFTDGRSITGLGVVFGDRSIAVGDTRGGLTVWAPVALYGSGGGKRLDLIHDLGPQASPPVAFAFTRHDRSFAARAADGSAVLAHTTSSRRLSTIPGTARALFFTPRGDTLVGFDARNEVRLLRVRNPHPESALRTLFTRVFYEGYDRPEFVWQSSSANDDSEPKLSLVPLLFGSIKATTYALLFAVPLALFGALYTSQFTTPGLRATIKPLVELMSAVPSVVIGILAALWLAPRIETALVGTMLLVVSVPLTTMLFATLWSPARRTRWGRAVERGWEFVIAIPILLVGVGLAFWVGPMLERAFFGGDFAQWCFSQAGVRIDQRNSLVIAFALGFAVIPTIFTMSEDALSNVPRSLTAASLALGASRWQTVRRVVLPSASPGVCAAIIVGFGRAVGETMIVLMATGNTPVMTWGPFSGMRTLSANIAVEIPEAPIGGTLYRTLFLSAVLLFIFTAVLNTIAEIIRQRLRKRYGY
jgi:phosphate transport system permease protein